MEKLKDMCAVLFNGYMYGTTAEQLITGKIQCSDFDKTQEYGS